MKRTTSQGPQSCIASLESVRAAHECEPVPRHEAPSASAANETRLAEQAAQKQKQLLNHAACFRASKASSGTMLQYHAVRVSAEDLANGHCRTSSSRESQQVWHEKEKLPWGNT